MPRRVGLAGAGLTPRPYRLRGHQSRGKSVCATGVDRSEPKQRAPEQRMAGG